MVNYAACYPGQGAQKPQMALDLYAYSTKVRDLFSLASEASKRDLYTLLRDADESELQQTQQAQLAITLANRSASTILQDQGMLFSCHAGFSLGELSAYAGAGVIDDFSLFQIVTKRGELMGKASTEAEHKHGKLAMAAVVGIGFEAVQAVLNRMNSQELFCANDNGPRQVVISGTAKEIDRCEALLKEAGARRIIPLRVSGPFHTPFMQEAEAEFSDFLNNFSFSNPKISLYANVTGHKVTTGDEVQVLCAKQLSSPVRWTTIMQNIVQEQDVTKAIEVGPGSVLTGLWKSSGLPVSGLLGGTLQDITAIEEEKSDE